MKTVVITGSARGFGLEMLKNFRENSYNTVICDVNETALKEASSVLPSRSHKRTHGNSGKKHTHSNYSREYCSRQNFPH